MSFILVLAAVCMFCSGFAAGMYWEGLHHDDN